MEDSYFYEKRDFDSANTLKPQRFDLNTGLLHTGLFAGCYTNISLFPVPHDNSVGTNDMHNAITIFNFDDSTMKQKKYFKDAIDDIGGGGQYIPVISPHTIGFGMTRSFVLYDFKNKSFYEYIILISLGETITKIAIADPDRKLFIFEIEKHDDNSPDPWAITKSLQLLDLNNKDAKLLKKIPKPPGTIWTAAKEKLFLYDIKKQRMNVFNLILEPAQDILEKILRDNKGVISLSRIEIHPQLPFAVLYGGRKGATFVSWEQGRDNGPHLLASVIDYVSFSPDGKWVVFQQGSVMDDKRTFIMPVSEKYPHYLGSPILLSNRYFDSSRFAWTRNPISFVGSYMEDIYRWELTKEAYPECGDRVTFHDCIVERDLEKLTREKRQGLGAQRH